MMKGLEGETRRAGMGIGSSYGCKSNPLRISKKGGKVL